MGAMAFWKVNYEDGTHKLQQEGIKAQEDGMHRWSVVSGLPVGPDEVYQIDNAEQGTTTAVMGLQPNVGWWRLSFVAHSSISGYNLFVTNQQVPVKLCQNE